MGKVPVLDATAVYDEESADVTLFAVNRDQHEPLALNVDIRSLPNLTIGEHVTLSDDDPEATNTADHPDPRHPDPPTRREGHRRHGHRRTTRVVVEHDPATDRLTERGPEIVHQVLQGLRVLGRGSILFVNGGSGAPPEPEGGSHHAGRANTYDAERHLRVLEKAGLILRSPSTTDSGYPDTVALDASRLVTVVYDETRTAVIALRYAVTDVD